MSTYTVISDVSNSIAELLKKHLIPSIIQNTNGIIISNPSERGEASLCIYLYDVREIRQNEMDGTIGMLPDGVYRQKYQPMYLELYYAITAFSFGDIKYRAIEEQKILGRVMQVLKDDPLLGRETQKTTENENGLYTRIEMLRLGHEEKTKILSIPNTSYRASVFYCVAPVELESVKTKEIQRVHTIDFSIQKGGDKNAGY